MASWWVLTKQIAGAPPKPRAECREANFRFWSRSRDVTSRVSDSMRFTSAAAAREEASNHPLLAEWTPREWWPGRFT